MNLLLRVVLASVFMIVGLSVDRQPERLSAQPSPQPAPAPLPRIEDDKYLGDDFVYDVVERANESVIKNLDAADVALLLVFAALAAASIIELDKIALLPFAYRLIADVSLAASAVCSILGYVVGIRKMRGAVSPATFSVDFATNPQAATEAATQSLITAYYANIKDRTRKRNLTVCALILLFFSVTVTNIVIYLPSAGR